MEEWLGGWVIQLVGRATGVHSLEWVHQMYYVVVKLLKEYCNVVTL
jgi:hypothetical protein